MAICMDYIKGGEVLIAPRLDFKYQYLLKCSECEECYFLLGPFVQHCSSHYDREEVFDDDNSSEEMASAETANDENRSDEFSDAETFEGIKVKIEPLGFIKDEDPLTNNNVECKVNYESTEVQSEIECEKSSSSSQCKGSSYEEMQDVKMVHADEEYIEVDEEEEWNSNNESEDESDEAEESYSNNTSTNMREFMQSDLSIATMIEAYKNQPKLWSYNLASQTRPIPDRLKCIKQIAVEIQNKLNVQLTTHQVSRIIVQLRHKYRVKLETEKVSGKRGTNQKMSMLLERLRFLKPYIENISIAVLDSHPNDLVPEQIIQILDIYKRYPQLWNSDTMENCCKSKREEALAQLKADIETEMDLEVDENSLKKYFRCVHVYFSRQKRKDMNNNKTKEPRFEFYDHMMFLYNYVGPFKCQHCARLFNGALQLKAHRYHHEGSFCLKCPECMKGFKSVDPYIAHVRRHMNDLGVECNVCGKGFLRRADLEIHMRGHTGDKPFFCDICGASFRHSQAFKVHRRRHEKLHSHFCSVCAKGCYTKNELNNHLRTHRDIRDFECEICGKAFKTKKTKQQHTFIHEEGRNHICPLCGKGYKNKIGLGHHIKTHGTNNTVNTGLSSIFYNE